MRRRGLVAAACLPWLGACAGMVTRPLPELAGRLSVRFDAGEKAPSRSFSADFDLRGDAEHGTLRLTGPLGATLAELSWQPAGAQLVDAQGTRAYPTLDALAQDLLGESLPMAALIAWLRGRPWEGASSQVRVDGFEQLGWHVALTEFAEGLLTASRERAPAVTVRARLERPS